MAVCSHCNKVGNRFFSYLDLSSACLNVLTLRSVNLIYFMVWCVGLVKTSETFNSAVNLLGHDNCMGGRQRHQIHSHCIVKLFLKSTSHLARWQHNMMKYITKIYWFMWSSDVRCHIKYWHFIISNTNATCLALLLHDPVDWEVALLFCICKFPAWSLYLKTSYSQILFVIFLNSWVDFGVDIKLGQDFFTSMFLLIHCTLISQAFVAVQYELFTALLNRPQTGIYDYWYM